MKVHFKSLIFSVAAPLAVGGLSAILTMESMKHFSSLTQPPLSPPAWLFPIAWSILYVLMGIASYLVFVSKEDDKTVVSALKVYGLQLAFNFCWSIFFFNLDLYFLSFVWLLALLALIILCAVKFYKIQKSAAYLLIPYIAWVAFAGYLNLAIAILN